MSNNIALKRIVAYIIDYMIITLISTSLVYITFINPRYDEYIEASNAYNNLVQEYYNKDIDAKELTTESRNLSYEINSNGYVYTIGNIIIIFLYYGVFVYFTKGQTLGKKIMGIKIVSNKEKELKIYNYFIRAFILNGVILSILTLIAICFKESIYLNIYTIASNFDMILMIVLFLMVLFNKDGRGIHDILAGTKVVDARATLTQDNSEEEIKIIKPKKAKKEHQEKNED